MSSKKDMIKRLEEQLARFHPECDMYAEIARQLSILKHPVFAALSDQAVQTIASNKTGVVL
jgi:hypothetical protein